MEYRMIQLPSVHNFRDIGGHPTMDGRRVRSRRAFRSGVMSGIDDSDAAQLYALGINTICDFRTNEECRHRPTRWHLAAPRPVDLWQRDYSLSTGSLSELLHASRTASDVETLMRNVYRTLVFEQIESYREFFLPIAAGRLPLIFNCSAGKDRTGIAAALLLTMLGVRPELVEEDYLATNEAMARLIPILEGDPTYGDWIRNRHAVAMPLLRAEREYLRSMFGAIEEKCGSLHGYLTSELSLSEDVLAAVRANLLE
jgi:protein-tyrosine phosphatase